tara:strand:+ start:637 stop:933 length:297 start_codon:yes stop_codon:yes gene_type:complete
MNGHKNWNHWNVSLWIWNTEALAKRAQSYIWSPQYTLDEAAKYLLQDIKSMSAFSGPFSGLEGGEGIRLSDEHGQHAHTPDGAPYTFTSIRAALAGMG